MISCCLSYDGDRAPVGSQRYPVARKRHVCGECGEEILPGEKYEYATWCWEGSWYSWKTCSLCLAVRNDHTSWGYTYGELWNQLADCYGYGPIYGDWDSDAMYDEDDDPMGPPPKDWR